MKSRSCGVCWVKQGVGEGLIKSLRVSGCRFLSIYLGRGKV